MNKILYNSVISFLLVILMILMIPSLYTYILEYYFIILLLVNTIFIVRLYRDSKIQQ